MFLKKYLALFDSNNEMNSIETSAGRVTLFALFVPIFVEQMLKSMMSTVNIFILGKFSDDAVASVGVASQVVNLQLMLYTVIGVGASIVITQYMGAGNKKQAKDVSSVSIVIVTMMGLVLGILMAVFTKPLMELMQLEEKLLPDAIIFFQIISVFSVFQALIAVLSAISRSYGLAKISMMAALIMNVFNAIGSYLVIYRPFEIPLYGVAGVAYCRVIAEIIALLIMLVIIWRNNLKFSFKCMFPFPKKTVVEIFKIGIPSGVDFLNYNIAQMISTGIIAVLGGVAIASKIYVNNVVFYVYIFGLSLGQSTALMVGWLVGAGKFDLAYRLNIRNLKVASVSNGLFSLIVYIFRYPIIGIFTKNKEIISLCASILLIDIFIEIFRGFNHVEQNSLRGAGDVRFPMIVSLCTCWTFSILLSYILSIKFEMGLMGCWIAFGMEEMFRGNILLQRWRSKKWMQKAIVKNESLLKPN